MILRLLLVLALAWWSLADAQAQSSVATIDRAEAVRSDWHADAPPAHGWEPVVLMDLWEKRWPTHDGVVWYRVRWQQADAHMPTGLLLDYTCLAAAVYLNGSLIERDRSLVEPLSRHWQVPRYFLLQSPLLRQGENELVVRVSGLVAYQPAFGQVRVGAPAVLQAEYRQAKLARHDMLLLDTAIGAVLSLLFGLFWLLRRQDTTYGWYALAGFFAMVHGYSYVASSPWPFSSTDRWQAVIAASYGCVAATHTIFLLRYSDKRWPRLEWALLVIAGLVLALSFLVPQWMGPYRNFFIVPTIALLYLASFSFLVFALRRGRRDQQVLGLCVIVPILVSFHDLAVYMGWSGGSAYLGSFTSPIMLLGMGFVLAYRFANTMRRVEGFNAELRHEVQLATSQLAETLQQQYALELAHSRAGERLQLVRDLHDGFGGTLVGSIARLEQAPQDMPLQKVIGVLREMRDDLRLVIDSTAREHADLAELIAPLRHRASNLLDAADIDARWHLKGIDGLELGAARSLDLLRLMQEALTNVFKHSRARRVDVYLQRQGDHLHLQVRDDGVGLAIADDRLAGQPLQAQAGMASMRQRALRLGGDLHVTANNEGQGTTLALSFPLAA